MSIRENKSGESGVSVDSDAFNFVASNVRLKQLIADAYSIKENLIFGVPKPLLSLRFDIKAKLDPTPYLLAHPVDNEGAMVLGLLEDRFALQAHTEARIMPTLSLHVGKNGPKFQPSSSAADSGTHIDGHGRYSLSATNLSMDALASLLSDKFRQPVINETDLPGRYDLSLTWSPDDLSSPTESENPTLRTALKEQLGLSLTASHSSIQVLIVDKAATPTPN